MTKTCGLFLVVLAACIAGSYAGFVLAAKKCPLPACGVETAEPPLALPQGPFRPRPPLPPEPQPQTDDDKRLFARIRDFVDARAEARAEARVQAAFDEVGANLDAYVNDQPQAGAGLGFVIVTKIVAVVVKVVKVVIPGLVLAALGTLLYLYWPWVAGAVAALVGLLRLWIGHIAKTSK